MEKLASKDERNEELDVVYPQIDVLNTYHRLRMRELFAIFVDASYRNENVMVPPSLYNHEMQLSLEERFQKLSFPKRNLKGKETKSPRFYKPNPPILVFQNFTPGKVYNVTLNVRNSYETMKPLQMNCDESQDFLVTPPKLVSRIALGMSAYFNVEFMPHEDKDYNYQIQFKCEDEKFIVPVIAIGSRPILDFPDDIYIPPGPVKISNTKIVPVRNIGKIRAVFTFVIQSPFSVDPINGVLGADAITHITLTLNSRKVGYFQSKLCVRFESGDEVFVRVHGTAENKNIMIDKDFIKFPDTYMGMKEKYTVVLHNMSDYVVPFSWKKTKNEEEDAQITERLASAFSVLQKLETKKTVRLETFNIIDPESHANVYSRIYEDEVKALKCEDFLFNHPAFSCVPLTGEIWPQSSLDIVIFFEPDRSNTYTANAYCDIGGIEERLSLSISAIGLGPQIAFNLASLNVNVICVSTTNCYELVAKNIGFIPGTICYEASELKCGGQITCAPENLILQPNDYGTFVLTFTSTVTGTFKEEIPFYIQESLEKVKLEILGKIVSPTVEFECISLNMGKIPFAFPCSHGVFLKNSTVVPIEFKLSAVNDGTEPSITFTDYAGQTPKPSLPVHPKEIIIIPQNGIVDPFCHQRIQVTIVPNSVHSRDVALQADIVNYKTQPVLLPIKYKVKLTNIISTPDSINLNFCFINYPYVQNIYVENVSDTPGFYHIVPQSVNSRSPICVSAYENQGILRPKDKLEVPLTIMTSSVGKQSTMLSLIVLGEAKQKDICQITCVGRGPVVSANKGHIDFGDVKLLELVFEELVVTNDSPIPADYMVSLAKEDSPWNICPLRGVLQPQEEVSLQVSVYLRDAGVYKDTIVINVHEGYPVSVTVAAVGVGSSLVIEPDIIPEYIMGSLFINHVTERRFIVTNMGTLHHQVMWSSQTNTQKPKSGMDTTVDSIFKITPAKFDLESEESAEIILEAQSDSVQEVTEEFNCFAMINNLRKKQFLFTVTIIAVFIEPKVAFSKPELYFRIDIGPNDEITDLKETVEVQNMSDLPHIIDFEVQDPFTIQDEYYELQSSWYVELDGLGAATVTVVFDPRKDTNLYSWKIRQFLWVHYREHTYKDSLPMIGEVNYPNVNLVPDVMDFGFIPVGAEGILTFELINVSPLPIKYYWYWMEESITIEDLEPSVSISDQEEEISRSVEEVPKPLVPDNDEMQAETTQETESDIKEMDNIEEEYTSISQINKITLKDSLAAISIVSEAKETSVEEITLTDLRNKLFPLINWYFAPETEMEALNALMSARPEPHPLNTLFQITPFYGELDPYETQIVSVSFDGYKYISAKAIAICKIEGGPSEEITVKGGASNISFKFNKPSIDFGYQIFCHSCCETIILSNLSPVGFTLKVNSEKKPTDSALEPGMLIIEPSDTNVAGLSDLPLIVEYFPGVIGKFEKEFTVEIGALDPITIKVHGFGIFPQLYVYLPRPEEYFTPPEIGYESLRRLSFEWYPKSKEFETSYSVPENLYKTISSKNLKELEIDEWDIVTYKDDFPSVIDIDLGNEQFMAMDYAAKNTLNLKKHSVMSRPRNIPEFDVPPYLIDIGPVTVNTSVSYSVLMHNYGPFPVTAIIVLPESKSILTKKGIFIKVSEIAGLPVGQTAQMQLQFNPVLEEYQEQLMKIQFTLYLNILHGARIPIEVKSIVAIPLVTVSRNSLDFRIVRCGDCKEMILTIKNEGLVTCKWCGTLQLKPKKKRNRKLPLYSPEERESYIVFSLTTSQDTLLPGAEIPLNIFFHPISAGLRRINLIISMENNPEKLKIPIKGTGMEPTLNIIDPTVEFAPALPYAEGERKLFTFQNPCPFPIEVIFRDFDSQAQEEERMLRVFCHYIETDQLLIPLRRAGDKLPEGLTEFYQSLIDDVGSKLEDETKRIQDEASDDKKQKKKQASSKVHSVSSRSGEQGVKISFPLAASLQSKTPDEIEILLHEHIDRLHELENFAATKKDPIKEALTESITAALEFYKEELQKEGVIIFFHGAPFTDSIYVAHRAASRLGIKILNVTQIFLETMAYDYSADSMRMLELFNSGYLDSVLPFLPTVEDEREIFGTFDEPDPLEEVIKKCEDIKSWLQNSIPGRTSKSGKNKDKEASKISQQTNRQTSTKKGAAPPDPTLLGTLFNIPFELLVEILRKRFQMSDCRKGVVIDNLQSIFFTSVSSCVTALLQASGNFKYTHCVILFNSYERYVSNMTEMQKAEEERLIAEAEMKQIYLQNISPEEAEQLSGSDLQMYTEMMLQKRREHFKIKQAEELHRRELLREKLRKNGKKGSKKNMKKGLPEPQAKTTVHKSVTKQPTQENSGQESANKKAKQGTKGKSKDTKESATTGIYSAFFPEFASFENAYTSILPILESWDRSSNCAKSSSLSIIHPKPKGMRKNKQCSELSLRRSIETPGVSSLQEVPDFKIGVPVWVVNCTTNCECKSEVIINLLEESSTQRHSQLSVPKETRVKPIPAVEYSCIPESDFKEINIPTDNALLKVFPISEAIVPSDAYQSESSEDTTELQDRSSALFSKRSLKKKKDIKRRKQSLEALSCSSKKEKKPQESDEGSQPKLKSRYVLNPDEKMQWQMQFLPCALGEYINLFHIQVVGRKTIHELYGKGLCDIPRIDMDPNVIFPHVAQTRVEGRSYRLTYFKDKEIFDFGAVLSSKLKEKEKRLYHVATNFTLSNCSTIAAEVLFSFLDKASEKVDAFALNSYNIAVMPGCYENVTIFANPHVLGPVCETLVLSIKNNPVAELIKISCTGAKVDFHVDTKNISFDCVLLYRKSRQILTLINKSLVPLLWHFIGVEDLKEYLEISDIQGLIMPLDNQEVIFDFTASKIMSISKYPLKLEVLEEIGRGEPLITEIISVSAESVDAMVDVFFADSEDKDIAFGNVKVGRSYDKTFLLKNAGSCDLQFSLDFDSSSNLKMHKLKQMLSLVPVSSVMGSGKTIPVRVTLNPTEEFMLRNVPVFKCHIINKEIDIAVIPICMSVSSLCSSYEVYPYPEMNLGPLTVGSTTFLKLYIKNTGPLDMDYTIANAKEPQLDNDAVNSVVEKQNKKKSAKRNDDKTSKKETYLVLGCFSLSSTYGKIPGDSTAVIDVTFSSSSEGTFSEEIKIHVSEESPKDKEGRIVELIGVASLPFIDFSDVHNIFQDHYICDSLRDFICAPEVGSHCVYVKEEKRLVFCRTTTGTKATAQLKLKNAGLVPCDMSVSISGGSKGLRSSDQVFSVSPNKFNVLPYLTEVLTITFAPSAIEMYECVLDVQLHIPQNPANKMLIKLSGDGCIPIVTIISPVPINKIEPSVIHFSPTVLGQMCVKELSLKNTGNISCKVIVELLNNTDKLFSICPTEETAPMLQLWTHDEVIQHTATFTFLPNQTASFLVQFTPKEVGKFSGDIKIFIIDNPYENLKVTMFGESYMEDITLDGLRMLRPSTKVEGRSKKTEISEDLLYYQLDFGLCYCGNQHKLLFRISNHSKTCTYRFLWGENPDIKFLPSKGHLAPNMTKAITALFSSDEPTIIEKAPVECNVLKIQYYEIPETDAWDDRMKKVHWLRDIEIEKRALEGYSSSVVITTADKLIQTNKKKVTEYLEEPEFETIEGSFRILPITYSAVVNFTKYECDTEVIEFPDTFMFKKQIQRFHFRNDSSLPLYYCWMLKMDEADQLQSSNVALQVTNSGINHAEKTLEIHSEALSGTIPQNTDTSSILSDGKQVGSDSIDQPAPEPVREPGEWLSTFKEKCRMESLMSLKSKEEYFPFYIEPKKGMLQPNEIGTFLLTFKPLAASQYRAFLTCNVPFLSPELEPLKIAVKAQSLMPFCHFDIEESDYLSSGRRDPSRPGPQGSIPCFPLDPETKVVELKILGAEGTHTKKFKIINPTESKYTFTWSNTTSKSMKVFPFHCATTKGVIESGKECEVVFKFKAEETGIFESFWNFCIPKHDIKMPFLILATVAEPAVSFLSSHVILCPTIAEIRTEQNVLLMNSDDAIAHFQIIPSSLYSDGRFQRLKVIPMEGDIQPNSEFSILIQFTPTTAGEINFKMKTSVKGMKDPLVLNVTGLCYIVQPIVTYEYTENKIISLSSNEMNVIDIGEIVPKYEERVSFKLTNVGKSSFYYEWKYNGDELKQRCLNLSFQDKRGCVTSNARVVCTMKIVFSSPRREDKYKIVLQIVNGPSYVIYLKASVASPSYQFSFNVHDFRLCFVKNSDPWIYEKVLTIKNLDVKPLVVDCCIVDNSVFDVMSNTDPILPMTSKDCVITFTPREFLKYEEKIDFLMNGCYKKTITVMGEGIPMKIVLLHPNNKCVDLGTVRTGTTSKATVPVVNWSRRAATVSFHLPEEPSEVVQPQPQENSSSPLVSPASTIFIAKPKLYDMLKLDPDQDIYLKPSDKIGLCITFMPTSRMEPFTRKILIKINGKMEPLCLVTGNSIGAEFSLDRSQITFGPVVEGCSASNKLLLMNTGDMGARFSWRSNQLSEDFSITPLKGYSSPGTEVLFTITFHPCKEMEYIRTEVKCTIEKYTTLTLVLAGSCVTLPEQTDVITFNTPVRKKVTGIINLQNANAFDWVVLPIFSGEYFGGNETTTVPANGKAPYTVTYLPLTMTSETVIHEGTVFFGHPTGQGLLYKLVGHAQQPLVRDHFFQEVPCKKLYKQAIPLTNWLHTAQRFLVTTTLEKPEKFDPVYEIGGSTHFDIIGNGQRDYILQFKAYRECNLGFVVTFENTDTMEYEFFEVNFRVVKCGPLEVITLSTCLRKEKNHSIKIKNPLPNDIKLQIACNSADIVFTSPLIITAESEGLLMFSYLPVHVGDTVARLEANCVELGSFPYELHLQALPVGPEKPICITASLGTAGNAEATVHNWSRNRADFSCKVDNPDFHVDKSLSVAGGADGNAQVSFEPTSVGNSNGILTLASPTAGEFIFPLRGTGIEPRPQGPFLMKPGGSVTITFRNIFKETKTFQPRVDLPAFIIKNKPETIKSKKDQRFTVSLQNIKGLEASHVKFPVTGKLTITCTDPKLSNIQWDYYLLGSFD